MRKNLLIIIVVLVLSLSFFIHTYAENDVVIDEAEVLEITGTIIDNISAEKYLDDLDRFILRYPKAQAVIPISKESGYSIRTSEGELYRFNEESNDKIFEFLQDRNNVVKVVIEAKEDEDEELELMSIRNQYRGARGETGY